MSDPTNVPESEIDKALGEDWPVKSVKRVEYAEIALIDIREKAADIANNGAEERDRFVARQIILLCEKALAGFNA